MGEAARQAAGTGVLGRYALAELCWGWGEAYRIGWDAVRGWWANRRDGTGKDIKAANHDQLWAAIYADYTASPVGRDYSALLAESSECQAAR
ncbi:MAG TPA: hypothetical protein VFE59_11070 [Trebonia sp.]|nr:hypothetical protein [Trebonia sp.]